MPVKTYLPSDRPQIDYLPTDSIRPNPKNPRKHSRKQIGQLCSIISECGFIGTIIIDKNGIIVAGHGRWLAAQELCMPEVPVLRVHHLSDTQLKAFMIADNKLTDNSSFDPVILGEILQVLTCDLAFDTRITGFDMGEIDAMIESAQPADGDDDLLGSSPIVPDTPITKLGDLWIIGQHRAFCGNSLEDASFQTLMQGERADLIFVDPPYNLPINGHVGGLGKIKHPEFAMGYGEMATDQFGTFLAAALDLLAKHSVDGSIHYVCMDWRHMGELLAAGKKVYSEFKNLCVWVKDNGGMGAFYRSKHELVFVFKKGTAAHKNNFLIGQHRYRTNVWDYPGANSFARNNSEGNMLEWHPTTKPVAMIADAIMDCTDRKGIVLDSFSGSFSTMIAAERTGRIFRGIELDPHYVDVGIRGWQKLTGNKARHAQTGRLFDEITAEVEASHVG